MALIVLLTGDPQSGKTAVIKRIISRLPGTPEGFYTEEIREGRERKGFRLVALDGREGVLAHADIHGPQRIGKYGVDLNVLDSIGVDCLKKASRGAKIILIDEIGPMQILSEKFRRVLSDVLKSDAVIVGTIANCDDPFINAIRSRDGVSVIEVRREEHDAVVRKVLRLIRKERNRD